MSKEKYPDFDLTLIFKRYRPYCDEYFSNALSICIFITDVHAATLVLRLAWPYSLSPCTLTLGTLKVPWILLTVTLVLRLDICETENQEMWQPVLSFTSLLLLQDHLEIFTIMHLSIFEKRLRRVRKFSNVFQGVAISTQTWLEVFNSPSGVKALI